VVTPPEAWDEIYTRSFDFTLPAQDFAKNALYIYGVLMTARFNGGGIN
jgi:hypothetical protein